MKYVCAYLTGLVMFASPVLGGEIQHLITACDGCHGPQGASAESDIPVIGGQSATSVNKALEQFKDWGRPCRKSAFRYGDTSRQPVNMCEISTDLSREEMTALAEYYAEQIYVPAIQEFDEAKALAGANLHALYCITCHPKGGSEAGYAGRLAGQWKPYLRLSIAQIQSGEWLVPKIMQRKMSSFTEDEIEALLDFFASQQD